MECRKNCNLRAENGRVYGFIKIIHSSGVVALGNMLILIVVGGQKDDRHIGVLLAFLYNLGQLESRDVRHADVENEQSKLVSEQCKQCLLSGRGPNQPVTGVIQNGLENGQVFRVIVNDQDVDGSLCVHHRSYGSSKSFWLSHWAPHL